MAVLIPTISGHKAQQGAFLRQVQGRDAAVIPSAIETGGISAELLGVDAPGMTAAAQVPAERIADQEAAQQNPVIESAPLRTVTADVIADG